MTTLPSQSITTHFASVKDHRTGIAQLHLLSDLIVIAVCAAIYGADIWVEVERWAKANRRWLLTFLALVLAKNLVRTQFDGDKPSITISAPFWVASEA